MPVERVEQLDLGLVKPSTGIQLEGRTPDGRRTLFGIDVQHVVDDFAYGYVSAAEERKGRRNSMQNDEVLGQKFVRVPLSGLLEPGDVGVELADGQQSRPITEQLDELHWSGYTVPCTEITFVIRGQ